MRCFAMFLNDLSKIPRFDRWVKGEAIDLDKDLMSDEREYSLTNCCFLTRSENNPYRKREEILRVRNGTKNKTISW